MRRGTGASNIPGLPTDNPCLVERFPEIKQPRYVPSEKDFWKVATGMTKTFNTTADFYSYTKG
jgi:hypothetical protein